MEKEMLLNKIKELLADPDFTSELETADSDDELEKLFERHGLEVTEETLKVFLPLSEEKELTDDDLENVAGGVRILGPVIPRKLTEWILRKLGLTDRNRKKK